MLDITDLVSPLRLEIKDLALVILGLLSELIGNVLEIIVPALEIGDLGLLLLEPLR